MTPLMHPKSRPASPILYRLEEVYEHKQEATDYVVAEENYRRIGVVTSPPDQE